MTLPTPPPSPTPTPTSRTRSESESESEPERGSISRSISLPRSQQSIETDLATLEAMIEELNHSVVPQIPENEGRRGRSSGTTIGGRRRRRCVDLEDVSGAMRVCCIR
ncbi:hypothetical protein ASPBRDRAFT_27420 [Aspergillus brasiliensis CBS 101740]|uniref:Uncharacterized protein n=1 Tax=Aspergillus brasiliensis (strain CBS 101740 / IMI 381727 / IBT 21946) TaxID=767769 RepID=A0A1L9URM5_ASPBC|nr:hypothetical protein ASPBRDRAFT_27420 [Aspergillus brasiliensis CBS 101740]